jgi:hypothetical protein
MKLQINSLDAIERLIGGDTEIELDIRGSIVQAFAKKHLKCIADSPQLKSIMAGLADDAIKVVSAQLGTVTGTQYWNQKINLNREVREELVKAAREAAQAEMAAAIKKAVEEVKADVTSGYIEKIVKSHVKATLDAEVKAAVNERFKKLAATLA